MAAKRGPGGSATRSRVPLSEEKERSTARDAGARVDSSGPRRIVHPGAILLSQYAPVQRVVGLSELP
ncbi:LOW QUALITY PROTEIN: hypothetical protein RTBOTA2_004825 [Rhodotorula toruloides]|nr:LOW QUALITY PROTEIN: hypothetical protein RTBOTA2_004825 [Rhodotorula toruloides]